MNGIKLIVFILLSLGNGLLAFQRELPVLDTAIRSVRADEPTKEPHSIAADLSTDDEDERVVFTAPEETQSQPETIQRFPFLDRPLLYPTAYHPYVFRPPEAL